jgi:hypothetical protein
MKRNLVGLLPLPAKANRVKGQAYVSNGKKVWVYCNKCKYSSYNNTSLKKHERIHTGVKPYSARSVPRALLIGPA